MSTFKAGERDPVERKQLKAFRSSRERTICAGRFSVIWEEKRGGGHR